VSRISLSHSSSDNREAAALKRWLVEQRPELANEVFLDIDPDSGLRVGVRWKGQLFESNSCCEAVICLVSAAWGESAECRTEYRTAEGVGKQILVARLEDTGDGDITSEWQRCDLFAAGAQTEVAVAGGGAVRFNTAALYALRKAIEGTGVGPQNFVWPP
jgi:TIR domain-containing protein